MISVNTQDQKLLADTVMMVLADYPEMFWVDGSFNMTISGDCAELRLSYLYSDSEIDRRMAELNNVTQAFLNTLHAGSSDYEKIKRVYEYIMDNAEYVADSPDNQNLYSVLINHKSVCMGYSKAAQYLMQRLGIQTLLVKGTASVDGQSYKHAWNIVRCEGNYYNFDVTFADCKMQKGEDVFKKLEFYNYAYLCLSDNAIRGSHNLDSSYLPVPSCNMEDLNYFKLNSISSNIYDSLVDRNMENNINSGRKLWVWQFENDAAFDNFLTNNKYGEYLVKYLQASSGYSYVYDRKMKYVVCYY